MQKQNEQRWERERQTEGEKGTYVEFENHFAYRHIPKHSEKLEDIICEKHLKFGVVVLCVCVFVCLG